MWSNIVMRQRAKILVIYVLLACSWNAITPAAAQDHNPISKSAATPSIDRVKLGMKRVQVKGLYPSPWEVFDTRESLEVQLPGTNFSREYLFGPKETVSRITSTGFALRLNTEEALNRHSLPDDVRRILGDPQEVLGQQWFYTQWGLRVKFDPSGHLGVVELNEKYRAK